MLSAWKKILGFFWMICTLQIIVYGYRKQGKKNTLFRIHGKHCSIAFIWRSKKVSNSRTSFIYLAVLNCSSGALPYCLFHCSQKKLTSLTQSIEQVFLSFFSFCLSRNAFDREYSLLSAGDKQGSAKYTQRFTQTVYCSLSCLSPPYIQFVFLWFLEINQNESETLAFSKTVFIAQ